jgi:CheY-like chemotaxis protein
MKHSFSVLFVDDEEQTRKYFKMGLKPHFEIFTAASVAEAKEILATNGHQIGVVITDQRMPGGNGVELLRFLKSDYPKIIRLLATAYSDLAEAIEAVNSGEIFRYIQKPWKDFDSLRIELSQAMDLFETRQQRDELLREKFTIRKKITKVERIRMLASLVTGLGFKFCAIQDLLKNFSAEEDNEEVVIENLDFGKADILEAKFQIDLASKIKDRLTNFDGKNLDKDFISGFLQTNAIDNGDKINFQINLPKNNNFLISNSTGFESEAGLNLLALCLFAKQHNASLAINMNNTILNCEIDKNGRGDVVDDLENTILSAILA